MDELTQTQINASRIISALADLAALNTEPRNKWGSVTLRLVRAHIRGWGLRDKREIQDAIKRIFEPEATQ